MTLDQTYHCDGPRCRHTAGPNEAGSLDGWLHVGLLHSTSDEAAGSLHGKVFHSVVCLARAADTAAKKAAKPLRRKGSGAQRSAKKTTAKRS